ncbi:MAG: hypothetical protein U0R17_05745 [Acidimicrobiia bacterium]
MKKFKSVLFVSSIAALAAGIAYYLRKSNDRVAAQAVDSTFTGLREWNSSLQREIVRSHRDARDVCIAVMTINTSEKKSDPQAYAKIEKDFALAVRGSDLIARNEDGEFFVLFPESGLDEGYEAVERLQESLPPTASLAAGIAVWDHCETAAELVSRAVGSMQGEDKASRAKISVSETPQTVKH